MSFVRRQHYRRLFLAARLALTSVAAAVLGLYLLATGGVAPGALFLAGAAMLGLRARHWLSLSARSRIGADSEDGVHRVVDPLRGMGWSVRHSIRWPGGGDIDSVVVAQSRVAFVVETKTRRYDERHLRRVREQAVWLRQARRMRESVPVLCIVRAAGVERCESGVLVVSIDRLVDVLWAVATKRAAA